MKSLAQSLPEVRETRPHRALETVKATPPPINHTAFDEPAQVAAWHTKPSWYVLSSKDMLLDPHAQTFFADRMKAKVTTVAGSHSSLASHAAEVAAVIESAAAAK